MISGEELKTERSADNKPPQSDRRLRATVWIGTGLAIIALVAAALKYSPHANAKPARTTLASLPHVVVSRPLVENLDTRLSFLGQFSAVSQVEIRAQVGGTLIIAAERRLAASNERIGVALSDYYPKISLSGALGFDSIRAGTLFNGRAFQAVGGGALRWRLFDFGRVKAEIAQARGAYAEAQVAYQQTALKATENIENAMMELAQSQARLEQLQDEVESLTRPRGRLW